MAEPWWPFWRGSSFGLNPCSMGAMVKSRLTYQFSHVGQWLDSVGDDITNCDSASALLWVGSSDGVWWLYTLSCHLGAQVLGSMVLIVA